jgi:hypothetical protein
MTLSDFTRLVEQTGILQRPMQPPMSDPVADVSE